MAETKIRARKATALLKDDHQKVKKLWQRYEKLEEDDDEKADLFRSMKNEITVHTRIEEEIFYPAIQGSEDEEAAKLCLEAAEEHRVVKNLLQELETLTPGEEHFDAKLKVLMDNLLHHIEEEQTDLFPIFEKLPKDERDDVAERLADRKRELAPEE